MQKEMLENADIIIVQDVHEQERILNDLLSAEEAFLGHKSRIKWLNEGETQYFYRVIKGRQLRIRISMLCYADGLQTTNEGKIKAKILGFYNALLGITDACCTGGNVEQFRGILVHKLSDSMYVTLMADVSREEIASVIKHMPSNKSLGPDGYTAEFSVVMSC